MLRGSYRRCQQPAEGLAKVRSSPILAPGCIGFVNCLLTSIEHVGLSKTIAPSNILAAIRENRSRRFPLATSRFERTDKLIDLLRKEPSDGRAYWLLNHSPCTCHAQSPSLITSSDATMGRLSSPASSISVPSEKY